MISVVCKKENYRITKSFAKLGVITLPKEFEKYLNMEVNEIRDFDAIFYDEVFKATVKLCHRVVNNIGNPYLQFTCKKISSKFKISDIIDIELIEDNNLKFRFVYNKGVQDIRDFLLFNKQTIIENNIINFDHEKKYLTGKSVDNLIELMKNRKIHKLIGPNDWYIDIDGNYKNIYASLGEKEGNIYNDKIERKGIVFIGQNTFLNPFYENYTGSVDGIKCSITIVNKEKLDTQMESEDDVNNSENEIDSLEKYVARIGALNDEFSNEIVWFRGHSSLEKYKLIPTLYRNNEKSYESESELLSLVKSYAIPYLSNIPRSDWEWMILMQHYGMPTRLLDFSEDPLIALSFAVGIAEENHKDLEDAVVWILKPMELNNSYLNELTGIPNITCMDDELNSLYKINKKSSRIATPLACIGILNNNRIIAQKGTFLLFPRINNESVQPFEDMCKDPAILDKIIIKKKSIKDIRNQLRNMGYNISKLYPSLENVMKDIKERYKQVLKKQ